MQIFCYTLYYLRKKFEGFAVLAWLVWKSRSLALFEKRGIDTLSTLASVNSLIQAYKDAQDSYVKPLKHL